MNDGPVPPRLILASRSPRRARLLQDAGYTFQQDDPPFADPPQPQDVRGEPAEKTALHLALSKFRSIINDNMLQQTIILTADTLCVAPGGQLLGQPGDVIQADTMLHSFQNATHDVVTGIVLGSADGTVLATLSDRATVHFGRVSAKQMQAYLTSGAWRGKAGGYNLFDRQAAGWPIRVEGDPATVVGLPMRKLIPLLARQGIHPGDASP